MSDITDMSYRWDTVKAMDTGKLKKFHWYAIITVSIGMFIWGFILAIAPLTTEWPFVTTNMYTYVLVSAPVSLLVGNLVIGKISDKYGRKRTFMLTLTIYSVGIFFILFAHSIMVLIMGLVLSEFGLGGEEPPALAYLAEMMPIAHREMIIIATTNFANFGAAVAGALAIVTAFSITTQRIIFGITLVLALVVMLVTRLLIPESYRWSINIEERRHAKSSLHMHKYMLRLFFLVSMAITIVLTYALLALVIGPYLFPRFTSWIVFTYNVGETFGGILAIFLMLKLGMKPYTLLAYLGGFITMIVILPQYLLFPGVFTFFLVLLFFNGVFGELGWGSRVVLEPELFPTQSRSVGVAMVRAIAYVLYIGSIFFTAYFTITQYLWYNIALWAFGLTGAIIWYIKGVETKRKTLEQINP